MKWESRDRAGSAVPRGWPRYELPSDASRAGYRYESIVE
jgi:hypothetical protein